jgi:hypothetical protein
MKISPADKIEHFETASNLMFCLNYGNSNADMEANM